MTPVLGACDAPSRVDGADKAEALDLLDQAFAEHDCLLTLLRAHDRWDPLATTRAGVDSPACLRRYDAALECPCC
jgi:hypothetical protein